MNQLFKAIINECNQAKSDWLKQAQVQPEKVPSEQLRTLADLVTKVVCSLKDNLTATLKERDGVYCVLFLRKVVGFYISSMDQEGLPPSLNQQFQECLDFVWQEMHQITSKLTKTKRKVATLSRSSSSLSANEGSDLDSSKLNESTSEIDDDLSAFDLKSSSEDLSQGSSSGASKDSASIPTSSDLAHSDFNPEKKAEA